MVVGGGSNNGGAGADTGGSGGGVVQGGSAAGRDATPGGTAGSTGTAGSAGMAGSGGTETAGAGGAAPRGPGQDYYCDPMAGLPTNPGTADQPWRRLEEVFAAGKTFSDGDIIHLRSGNHGSPVVKGGIAAGERRIISDPEQTPVLGTLRFADGATHWKVDGVLVSPAEADGSFTSEPLVQLDAGAANDVLQNSQVRYAPDAAAQTWDNAAWVAKSGTAIYVIGKNNQILDNHIRNTRNGVMLERTSVAGAGATGTLVQGNSVDHFWEDAFRAKVGDCTFEYNSATNSYAVVPSGTEADPPHRDMLQSYRGDAGLTSIDNVVARGNVFIARRGERYSKVPFQYNGHYTIQGLSAFDGPYRGWTIENNVIMVEVGLALYGMDDSTIANNTVVPDPFGADSEIRLADRKDGTPSKNNVVVNNLVHTLNISAGANTIASNNLTVATGAYPSFFLDYAGYDLHLRPGSAAINAGTMANAPTLDADRAMRAAPFDAGAFEASGAPP